MADDWGGDTWGNDIGDMFGGEYDDDHGDGSDNESQPEIVTEYQDWGGVPNRAGKLASQLGNAKGGFSLAFIRMASDPSLTPIERFEGTLEYMRKQINTGGRRADDLKAIAHLCMPHIELRNPIAFIFGVIVVDSKKVSYTQNGIVGYKDVAFINTDKLKQIIQVEVPKYSADAPISEIDIIRYARNYMIYGQLLEWQ